MAVMGLALAMLCGAPFEASGAGCKPSRPKPVVILKNMGTCVFDQETMRFSGEPADEATCLMRSVDKSRNLGPPLERLPHALTSRVGQSNGLPSREALSAFLSRLELDRDFGAHLWKPVSRANDNDPDAPAARYFVIHDTSGPNYGHWPFPLDIDVSPKINNLNNFKCSDGWERAHAFVNRSGAMLRGHDFSVPWRATKFERAINFSGALKGLFLHVELIQPRRSARGLGRRNDAEAPSPGFTPAQYDSLALLYTIASVRAQAWLIPAFHAAIDSGIRGGHDDPLNFEIEHFANSLDVLVDRLQQPEDLQAARNFTDGSSPGKASEAPTEAQ
jgi:hypothetical protein